MLSPPGPLVISHAACAGHAPENTLAGIRAALTIGADAVEVDVQASADGVPVLMHDLTLNRTTNGSGPLADRTLQQLRALDAGGDPIPSFDEALALTRGRALLIAEIKAPRAEQAVARVARHQGALQDVMVWSFSPSILEAVRSAEARLPTALLIAPQSASRAPPVRDLALRLGLRGISIFHEDIDGRTVSEARRSNLSIYAWTADSQVAIQRLIDLGIDGIVTNYPERALALLGRPAGSA